MMVLPLFFIALVFALWWAVLWLWLPIDWESLATLPKLVTLHLAPPVSLLLAFWSGKRLWAWRKGKRKQKAEKQEAAEKQQAQEAARAAHAQSLEARRAGVECRGVWASLTQLPKWPEELPPACALLEQKLDAVQGIGQEAAVNRSLHQVLKTAFMQNEALAWLPIRIHTGASLQSQVELAWQQAIESCQSKGMTRIPPSDALPDCQILPGGGSTVGRVLDLFGSDPHLPALLLLGLGSPLAGVSEKVPSSAQRAGHAVVALLLARPGLVASDLDAVAPPPGGEKIDPNLIPHWERKAVREQAPSVWGQMPAHLQPGFLEGLPVLASITRPRVATPGKRPRASVANAQQTIEEAFIDAGLRDIPYTEPGDQGGKQEQTAQEKPDVPEIEPDVPEIGWIVHDLPGTDGLSRISSALCGCNSDLDMAAQSTSVPDEQGNVSAAHGVLMQALSFARAAQLQQPVLLCETHGDNAIALAFACPCGQGANSEPPLTNANG